MRARGGTRHKAKKVSQHLSQAATQSGPLHSVARSLPTHLTRILPAWSTEVKLAAVRANGEYKQNVSAERFGDLLPREFANAR